MNRSKNIAVLNRSLHALVLVTAGGAGWLTGERATINRSMSGPGNHGSPSIKPLAVPGVPFSAPAGWARARYPAVSAHNLSRESDRVQRAAKEPEAVVAEVMAQPPGSQRNGEILELLRGWVTRDPVAAAEWLAGLDPRETPAMPFADVEPIFAQAPAKARAKGLLGFLAAKADSGILLDAAEGRGEAEVRHFFADKKQRADRSPMIRVDNGEVPFLSAPMNEILRSEERVSTFGLLLNERAQALAVWASQEPEAALDWVRSRPGLEARQWLMNSLVGALAANGAADQAIELYNSDPDTHELGAVRSLGKAWAVADPRAALAWSRSIPDAALRDEFITASIHACPAGQAPELLEYTSHIEDPERRRQAREHLIAEAVWHQAAAREWLEIEPTLDETERAHLQAHLEAAIKKSR